MDYSVTAKQVLEAVGGEQNITAVTFYMTRLCFVLKDDGMADDKKIAGIPGVLGLMKKTGQYQVIIGNHVEKCYNELLKLGKFPDGVMFGQSGGHNKSKRKINPVVAVSDAIVGSVTPVIPAIIGCGLIKTIYLILCLFVSTDNGAMVVFSAISDCAFYFLQILVAFAAAKKFGANQYMCAAVVGLMIHPTIIYYVTNSIIPLIDGGVSKQALSSYIDNPLYNAQYSYSVVPAILIAYVMSWIDKGAEKICPTVTKRFLKPLLVIGISAVVAVLAVGPACVLIGYGLERLFLLADNYIPVPVAIVISLLLPYMMMCGMNVAFFPMMIAAVATPIGETLIFRCMLISNLAIGASCVAVAIRTKDRNFKQVAFASGVCALAGGAIEAGLYGVILRERKALIPIAIACAVSGCVCGILNVSAYSYSTPALLTLNMFSNSANTANFAFACISACVAIVISFTLTLFLPELSALSMKLFGKHSDKNKAPIADGENKKGEADNKKYDKQKNVAQQSNGGADADNTVAKQNKNQDKQNDKENKKNDKKNDRKNESKDGKHGSEEYLIGSPVAGKLIELKELPAPNFADGTVGKGVAILPSDGKVYAPFNGKVNIVMGHAVGLKSENGVEILIHVGIETVGLDGKHYISRVHQDKVVKKGDLLLEADLKSIEEEGYKTFTPILITNTNEFKVLKMHVPKEVEVGNSIIKVAHKKQ